MTKENKSRLIKFLWNLASAVLAAIGTALGVSCAVQQGKRMGKKRKSGFRKGMPDFNVNATIVITLISLNTKFECLVPLSCQVHGQAALGEVVHFRPLGEASGTFVIIWSLGDFLQQSESFCERHLIIIFLQINSQAVITILSMLGIAAKFRFQH